MDKRKISIILAAVLALMAVVMVKNYISQTEKKYVREEKKAYILVAATNIGAGVTIDENMVKFESIPEPYVQPKAISSQSMAVGRRAVLDIFQGEQIMSSKLIMPVKDTSLSMRTPQGKRAITITISSLSAVGGKIRPNDYVDVIGTLPYNANVDGKMTTELVTVTLFQNVLILGIDGGGGGGGGERGKPVTASSGGDLVVTLALSPKEITLLSYVLDQGRLKLVLRPPLETAVEPVPPVEVNALWQYVFSNLGQEFLSKKDNQPQAIAQPQSQAQVQQIVKQQEKKPEPSPTIEIYRGTEKSNMEIK